VSTIPERGEVHGSYNVAGRNDHRSRKAEGCMGVATVKRRTYVEEVAWSVCLLPEVYSWIVKPLNELMEETKI
jgi:hypothetical protein